jgi:hypothetical protein
MDEIHKSVYKILKQSDHFILIMICTAIGSKLKK